MKTTTVNLEVSCYSIESVRTQKEIQKYSEITEVGSEIK